MFCEHCGKEINDEAVICVHCGAEVKKAKKENSIDYNKSKVGFGVLCALLLNLIGILVGILIYPENTVARKTFIKGWLITTCVGAAIGIVATILLYIFSPLTFLLFL